MAEATINPGAWSALLTTTAETSVVNKSYRVVFFTTGATGGLALDKGTELPPYQPVVFRSGLTVSLSVLGGSAIIEYGDI